MRTNLRDIALVWIIFFFTGFLILLDQFLYDYLNDNGLIYGINLISLYSNVALNTESKYVSNFINKVLEKINVYSL